MTLDDAANELRDRWWERDVNALVPSQVERGAELGACSGEKSLIVRSAAQVRSFWSLVKQRPLTMFSCAVVCHWSGSPR